MVLMVDEWQAYRGMLKLITEYASHSLDIDLILLSIVADKPGATGDPGTGRIGCAAFSRCCERTLACLARVSPTPLFFRIPSRRNCMDLLDRMLDRDEWATRSVLELSVDLSDEQLDQVFDVGLGTLRKTLRHIVRNIPFWTSLATGEPVDDPPDLPSVAEVLERYDRAYPAYAAFAREVQTEGRLDETFIDHWNYPQSMGGTVIQVLMHNEEHRTEALHILKRLGVRTCRSWTHRRGST